MENAELRVERARLRAKVQDLVKDNEALTLTINKIDPASLAFFGIDDGRSIVTQSPASAPAAEARPASGDHTSYPLTPEVRKELMAELKKDIMEVIKEATSPVKNSHSEPLAERAHQEYDSPDDLRDRGSLDLPFGRNSGSFTSFDSAKTEYHYNSRGGLENSTIGSKGTAPSVDLGRRKQMAASMDSISNLKIRTSSLESNAGSAPSEPEHKVSVRVSPNGKFIINDGLAESAGAQKGADHTSFEKLARIVILKNLIAAGNVSSSSAQGMIRTITEFVGRWGVVAQPVKLAIDKNDGTSMAVVEMRSKEQAARMVEGMDGAVYNGNVIKASLAVPWGVEWNSFRSSSLEV
jgi:hypothetical protein